MDIKGYNCPNCGGIVLFDIATQKAACRSCGAVFEAEALADYQPGFYAGGGGEETFDCAAAPLYGYQPGAGSGAVGGEDTFDCAVASDGYQQGTGAGVIGDEESFECAVWEEGGSAWENPEDDDLTTGACPSCGAELYGGKTTVAMVCPCCGNAQIVAKRIQGMLKPDSIIPFKYDKDRAVAALGKFCEKRKLLLPSRFIKENRLDGIQGVYAPFWLFDAEVEGNIEYAAEEEGNNGKNTFTRHYSVIREGDVAFEKIPVDGSEKMDDDYMDAIEPFEYGQLEDFHPSYLAGYAAEMYDVDAEKSKRRAQYRMEATVEELFEDSVSGYDKVTVISSDVKVKKGKVSYALFPVWTVNTKYNGDRWLFMMNGQTGKLVGRLPVDEGKAWMCRVILTGILDALIFMPMLYYLNVWGVLGAITTFILEAALHVLTLGQERGVFFQDNIYKLPLPFIIIMALIFSALCAFKVVRKLIYNMDTAREQTKASDYVVPGSFNMRIEIDERIR